MSDRASLDEIKALLVARVDDVAARLCPDGRRNGRYWISKSPLRADKRAGSFWINLSGPMAGTYHDAATGETGDMLKLVGGVYGYDFKGALAWARDYLGLARMSEAERRERIERATEARGSENARAAGDLERARKWAFGTFVAAKKHPFLGSPADRYLQSRGIDVRSLGRMPGVLGWLPQARLRETGDLWPVMVAGFTCPETRKIVSVHRTFLEPDGSDKLHFSKRDYRDLQSGEFARAPARKIYPAGYMGAAIRLWRGETGMSVEEAAKHGLRETLVIVEGIEDGLSVALARPDLRIWCAGTLGNLAQLVLPECCDTVIVCADNDWGKSQAQRALDAGIAALMRQGASVSVARSPVGKDANDALRGAR